MVTTTYAKRTLTLQRGARIFVTSDAPNGSEQGIVRVTLTVASLVAGALGG